MTHIFVDTLYWIALFNPRDQWHTAAVQAEGAARGSHFVTTESVLAEVLNYFSGYGPDARRKTCDFINDILADESVETLSQTHDEFLAGVTLYGARLDKSYSLTDCVSMNVMRERGISDVLTHDEHFAQEGFRNLL